MDFSDTANIHRHVMDTLKSIPEERFQQCSEQWQHQLNTIHSCARDLPNSDRNFLCVCAQTQCLWQHSRNL